MDDNQVAVQKLLQQKLYEIQRSNPAYSLRAFAQKTGISSGALSQILNGKRRVSAKIVQRLVSSLTLDPQERAELLGDFHRPKIIPKTSDYLKLSADQFKVIGDWHHLAIMSLMNTRGFMAEPEAIARRLGIASRTASDAIERLLRLGLLERNKKGALKRGAAQFRTEDDVASVSIRKSHSTSLQLAQRALDSAPVTERDFTSITMAINPDKIPDAKALIRKFQDDLAALLETGPRTEVYQMAMQLFSLSKKESK